MSVHTFFIIKVKYTVVNGEFWVPYGGAHSWQCDWWNRSPVKFASEESAMYAIKSDRNFKECCWRIVKTIVTEEVVEEQKR